MRATGQWTGSPQPGRQHNTVVASAIATGPWPTIPRIDWDALRTAGRSCCCPAKPAVIAVIPPASGREHGTELLLCMHHFRVHKDVLIATGATALNLQANPIPPDSPAYLAAV